MTLASAGRLTVTLRQRVTQHTAEFGLLENVEDTDRLPASSRAASESTPMGRTSCANLISA